MSYPDPQTVADRYAAVWNESDPEARRRAVRELWHEDGVHVLQPPQELREAARAIGFAEPELRARGHAELDARVNRAYEEFVASGTMTFRAVRDAERLGNVIKFRWEAVLGETGEAGGGGLEFVVLAEDGRIVEDYQFIES
ncbi:hypothetical protein ACFYU9_19760 [Streptomyces sp. NPDC004327]|uniref:hypothetical protein n=1 Tax=unclassified Streptomyces TaxID=2593676 RepID=UPI0036C18851